MSAEASRPDLTVIVVTHNRAQLALDTLRSAHGAMGTLQTEWLVVDSGSTDGTPALIEQAYADVRVIRCANVGFAAANNRAIALARGRYVLFLNPDVEVLSGTFQSLLTRLDERRELGLVSVIQRAPDGALQYSIRRDPSLLRTAAETLGAPRISALARWGEREMAPESYVTECRADWLVGALLLVRAEALRRVGQFDERFFLYSEETDWCYRFRQAGWEVWHLPLMTVIHHTGGEYGPDLLAQLSYAKVLFARKHYGGVRAGLMRVSLVVRHLLRVLVFAARADRAGARQRVAAERRALGVLVGVQKPPFPVHHGERPQVQLPLSRSSSR